MSNKRSKSASRTINTINPEVSIHTTYPAERDKKIRVSAYAVNKKGSRISKIITRTAKTYGDIEHVISDLVELVLKEINTTKPVIRKTGLSKGQLDEDTEIVKAFRTLKSNGILLAGWSQKTQKNAFTYFEAHTLPELMYCAESSDFGTEDLNDLRESFFRAAMNRKTKGVKNPIIANRTATNHINEAAKIYGAMRTLNPSLPELYNLRPEKAENYQYEQIKMIPIPIHLNWRKNIYADCINNPALARGAALMDAGLRAGEGSAFLPHDMLDMGKYIVVFVRAQEYEGKRTDIMKTSAAYRLVVLDEWECAVIRKCNSILEESDLNDEKKNLAPIEGTRLSAYVRDMLIQSGCDDEFMAKATDDMMHNPDYDDDGKPVLNLAAHVMRRHRVTLQSTILGYTRTETDYTIGHQIKIPNAIRESFKNEDVQLNLSIKNSRYNIDPDFSVSPADISIPLEHGQDIALVPFEHYKLHNNSNEPLYIDIYTDAAVCGETIEINVLGEVLTKTSKSTFTKKDQETCNIDIIGSPKKYL